MFKKIPLLFAAIILSFFASAQAVIVRGTFLADSARIGEPIPYSLTVHSSRRTDILFPDSTFSFAPFEYRSKKIFPTVTKDTLSYDSVVYYLSGYEVQETQHLALPVFIVHPQDCTRTFATPDSMRMIQTIKALPDSINLRNLHLKTNTAYQKVKWTFNYIFLLLIGGVLLVIGGVGWLLFGRQIGAYFTLRRLQRNHIEFLQKINQAVEHLKVKSSPFETEKTLLIWKKYMEGLAGRPFTKSTSKEILKYEPDPELGVALRAVDRIIYGGLSEFAESSFTTLRTYAENQYQKKMEEVKNG